MSKNYDPQITKLKNIIKIGTVHSIDHSKRVARVKFQDKGNLISAPLKVVKNQPTISLKGTELEYSGERKTHTHTIEITPWMPRVGEMVVCIFIPDGDGDGFVLGGI